MKNISRILVIFSLLLSSGCITEFVPKTTEDQDMLVVEGLITDKPDVYTIKLSKPFHLGLSNTAHPITGCNVSVSDNTGQTYSFTETAQGTYVSDSAKFQGIIGRTYTLHISSNTNSVLNYESFPVLLKAVPPIDSVYYEKIVLGKDVDGKSTEEGCRIYLNTHDPKNECKFYRWEYSETWEFRLPYSTPNNTCWLSSNSDEINIKNTSVIAEAKVEKLLLTTISNETDRLRERYSILVKQYSLNEDEYLYWEKLENISEQVGGLYDIIPSSIPSNIYCLDDPTQKVLGYFSVSSSSTKRIFINDKFKGIRTPYTNNACISDTIFGSPNSPIAWLGIYTWVIVAHTVPPPSYRVLTRTEGCYDCTVRGTNIMPAFWAAGKK